MLYWKDPGGILLKCLEKYEVDAVIAELHSGVCGGHKYWKEVNFLQNPKSRILLAYPFLICVSSS